jgi:hypothetical protein
MHDRAPAAAPITKICARRALFSRAPVDMQNDTAHAGGAFRLDISEPEPGD